MATTSTPVEKKPYRRLPGKKKDFLVGTYQLWQGSDHLLQIYTRFGVEDYKRFYYSDIQSFVVHKTTNGRVLNLILAILSVLFAIFAASSGWGWDIFWGLLAGLFSLLLIINWLRGPTCKTQIKTAVQTESLHSLHRLRTSMKVLDQLAVKVQQIQGPVEARQTLQQIPNKTARPGSSFRRRPTGRQSVPQPLRREKGLVEALRLRFDSVERRLGIEVDYEVTGQVDLPPNIAEALYWAATEALNNSLKHAGASHLTIRLTMHEPAIELVITDNGCGFEPVQVNRGMGLQNIRQRLEQLNDCLLLSSAVGAGTTVEFAVSLDGEWVKQASDARRQ